MSLAFIAAMGRNREIGLNNKLPWRLPADLAYVKKLTLGHTLLMGRKTFESLGRPLPGRKNVILTHRTDYHPEGTEVVHSVEDALSRYAGEDTFIFGGEEIFRLFFPYADKMYITRVDQDFAADTFFPEYDESEWRLVSEEPGVTNEKNRYAHKFLVYERIRRKSSI